MRILSFNVKNQTIEKDPSCDFSGLVAGSKGYLAVRFTFSDDWDRCSKVVGFFAKNGKEFPPCILLEDNVCRVPDGATAYHEFSMKVYGKRNGCVITTRPIVIRQYGGIE